MSARLSSYFAVLSCAQGCCSVGQKIDMAENGTFHPQSQTYDARLQPPPIIGKGSPPKGRNDATQCPDGIPVFEILTPLRRGVKPHGTSPRLARFPSVMSVESASASPETGPPSPCGPQQRDLNPTPRPAAKVTGPAPDDPGRVSDPKSIVYRSPRGFKSPAIFTVPNPETKGSPGLPGSRVFPKRKPDQARVVGRPSALHKYDYCGQTVGSTRAALGGINRVCKEPFSPKVPKTSRVVRVSVVRVTDPAEPNLRRANL